MKAKVLVAAGLSLALLVGCEGQEGRKQKYMAQAEASFKAEDYDKARIGYKNALKIDPKSIEAQLGYGKTLEKLQEWRGAVSRYRAVLELDPEHTEAKIKLGQLYILANAVDLADEQAEAVLAKESQNPAGLTLKAGVLAKQRKVQEAQALVEEAYQLDPASIDAIVLLASLKDINQDRAGAIALLEKETVNHPDSVTLHGLLARVYAANKQPEKTEQELIKLTELKPENIAFKKQLAFFYEKAGRLDEADSVFKSALQLDPSNDEAIVGLFQLYTSRNENDKAESFLQDQIRQKADNSELKFKLASFYVNTKRAEKAEAMYREMLKSEDELISMKSRNRLAYLLDKRGETKESEALIAQVLDEQPGNIEALTLRGTNYLRKGDALNAIADLRSVLNNDPDNLEALKLIGAAHIIKRENDLAQDAFLQYLNIKPADIPVRLQLADLYNKEGDTKKAIQQLEVVGQIKNDDKEVMDRLVQAYMSINEADKAYDAAQTLLALDKENPRTHHYLGMIQQSKKNYEEAIASFEESLRLKPGAIEPMSGKVRSLVAMNKSQQALKWLDDISAEDKTNPVAQNLKGELLMSQKEYSKARRAFAAAVKANNKWWVPYRNQALLSMTLDEISLAIKQLEQGVAATKGNLRLRMELATLSEKHGDYNEAIAQYDAILKQDDRNAVAINNLAMLLASFKSDSKDAMGKASKLADVLAQQDNFLFKDTAGWVYYKAGNMDKALPLIREAFDKYPKNPEINYHLGMVLLKKGDDVAAKRHLEKALSSDKQFRESAQAKAALDGITSAETQPQT